MNLSEQQAKEVLDFLANKCNCYICSFVEFYKHKFTLYMRDRETGVVRMLLYDSNAWNNNSIFSQQESYASYLKACLDVAREYDIAMCNGKYVVFMSKNVSLEQILLDMDLSVNV